MKTFDFYEFTGILCPGAVVLFTATLIIPEIGPIVRDQSLTVGNFGLFVVLSYVAGHLVQAFGNLLENGFWRIFGGMPTDWVRTRKHFLLTDAQVLVIEECLRDEMGKALSEHTANEWCAVTSSVYSKVKNAGLSGRVDTFNANYGLFRGLVAAFLLSIVIVGSTNYFNLKLFIALLACSLLALARMKRFGIHYARELFVEFLRFSAKPDPRS